MDIETAGPGLRPEPAVNGLPTAPAPASQLFGVFCTSAANCWAVGDIRKNDVDLNAVLHWTGKHWSTVAVPNPAGTGHNDGNELFAVRCTSASDCWAVGEAQRNETQLDEALHWNGRKWFVVATPTPAGTLSGDINVLNDVTCASARDCWAVGDYGSIMSTMTGENELLLNQALHWNGADWTLVSTPNPAGQKLNHASVLDAVRCASSSDCWAAGAAGGVGASTSVTVRNEMLHWNGKHWFKQAVPSPGGTGLGSINDLNGLACASAVNCWAAGFAGHFSASHANDKLRNEMLHWNGKGWFKQAVPNPGGAGKSSEHLLFGITCSSARNCWAVGSAGNLTGGPMLNEALHWNGTSWSSFSTPNPGGTGMGAENVLNSARCTGAANCWAVGLARKPGASERGQILHWTGRKWFAG